MDWTKILENALYFLALLNPASKVLFLATYEPELTRKQIFELSWKSSGAAFLMLMLFEFVGLFVLKKIFRIDLYALQITGGLVIFVIGWLAVREGRFFQKREHEMRQDFNELSVVPLAAPLIAGPGTITIVISYSALYGNLSCMISVAIALTVNFITMLFSQPISRLLHLLHLTGPLIRITGLIVAAVAVQMVLNGITKWLKSM